MLARTNEHFNPAMSPLDYDLTNFDANGAAPLRGENLGKWTPSIHPTVVRLGKSWSFEDRKTMRSKRTISIPDDHPICERSCVHTSIRTANTLSCQRAHPMRSGTGTSATS